MATSVTHSIRVGIGGWTYEPWRGPFYPPGLPHRQELAHASRSVTAIEINGTYYSTQSPKSFARWRDETPDGFVFSMKAHRFTTNRRVLAEAGESVQPSWHCCQGRSTGCHCAMCWTCGTPAS
jgi:uncharacterized protein YecE (DUF72 family)